MNNYYVYMYRNPLKDNIPFYVGKGKGNRMYDHLYETVDTTLNRRKFFTIQSIKDNGSEPIIETVQSGMSEEEAYQLETSLIQKYGRAGYDPGGILTNVCIDNRPPSQLGKAKTAAHRAALSKSHSGKRLTEETRDKIREITKARIEAGEFGHKLPHCEDAKRKISQTKTGTSMSPESSIKKSKALKGKPWTKARRDASTVGNKPGPKKGKPWSEARRLAQLTKSRKNT